ncbi:MAG: flagellar protein FliT [Pseudomonas sp. PGPPP4]|uniref:flagellar protein FliT n=1 Tax=Pseudomonas TaxID=286 RepID=UPI000BC66F6A|nr:MULTISPECIES: flagellar protein FliT [Pseudomonas]NMZ63083.1 flagellar protein FliT [Pseudomonas oryzihabitans]OYT81990.1 MAG: flagellar protein FliT [Pseudomonas sp. PGPPP4]
MATIVICINQLRGRLEQALAEQDWEAIRRLDLDCRLAVDAAMQEGPGVETELTFALQNLLKTYKTLIAATTAERSAIAVELTQAQRADKAAKVYQLFG